MSLGCVGVVLPGWGSNHWQAGVQEGAQAVKAGMPLAVPLWQWIKDVVNGVCCH